MQTPYLRVKALLQIRIQSYGKRHRVSLQDFRNKIETQGEKNRKEVRFKVMWNQNCLHHGNFLPASGHAYLHMFVSLPCARSHDVGWVERSDTHQPLFAIRGRWVSVLYPSYKGYLEMCRYVS